MPATAGLKQCTKCKTLLPTSRFSKDAQKADGLQSHCKGCRAQLTQQYQARDDIKEHRSIAAKEYRAENRERILEYQRQYDAANKERVAAALQARAMANMGCVPTGNKQCTKCGRVLPVSQFGQRLSNRDALRAWCKDCSKVSRKAWYMTHREYQTEYTRQKRQEYKRRALTHYGGGKLQCVCCGETDIHFLTLDHIDGSGGKARREGEGGGAFLYIKVIKQGFPYGYRTLCFNCNTSYGFYGMCPHQEVAVNIRARVVLSSREAAMFSPR